MLGHGRMGALSRLHAFPKPEQHLTQQTLSGGIVSVLGTATVLVLLFHEVAFFLTPKVDYKMSVDATSRHKMLPIFFDITFPSLPCPVIELDTMDSSGEADMDLHGTGIRKTRLDSQGYRIGQETVKRKKRGASSLLPKKRKGAASSEDLQIRRAQEENLPVLKDDGAENPWDAIMNLFNTSGLEQEVKEMNAALDNKEGCRITGSIAVPRVAGNLHISVHVKHFYVIQRVFPTSERINMSHFVHTFGFGAHYPGRVNPLDGVRRTIHPLAEGEKEDYNPHAIGTFKYFLKVVPTQYVSVMGRVSDTNQFSVSEFFQEVDTRQFGNLPAVNFIYDLSPIAVLIKEEQKNPFHFLTRLCAVIGGAFALTGMLNKLVFFLLQHLNASTKRKR